MYAKKMSLFTCRFANELRDLGGETTVVLKSNDATRDIGQLS